MSNNSTSMIEVTLHEARDLMLRMFKKNRHLSYMLWGKAGVGKSALGRYLADKLSIKLIDVRLPQFDPVDLRGLPTPDLDKMVVKWLIPEFLPTDSNCLLMLDEIAAAPKLVQVAAYQLILDRQLGEYKLPDNVIVIAASNPEGTGVCQGMPQPLANRFAAHFYIKPDVETWKNWALGAKIDSRIIAFMNQHGSSYIHTDSSKDGNIAFASPRSWELLSNQIKGEDKLEGLFPLIYGCVGSSASQMFLGFAAHQHKMPNIKDILDGKPFEYPDSPEVMYHAIAAMISMAIDRDSDACISAILNFSTNIPQASADYGVVAAQDICSAYKDRFGTRIVKNPSFKDFADRYKKYLL